MREIYLIRHGESLQNKEDRLSGITDIQLSDTGRQQCIKLKEFFKRIPIERVFASPLSRAVESANLIFPKREVAIANELIEFDYGDYEGVPRSHDDEIMRRWNAAPAEVVFPGGKHVREHAAYVYNGLLRLARDTKAHYIACVSHRTTIRLIVAQVLGLDLNKFRLLPCSNCSVTVLLFDETQGFYLQALNTRV